MENSTRVITVMFIVLLAIAAGGSHARTQSGSALKDACTAFERPDVADIPKATADEMRGLWNS